MEPFFCSGDFGWWIYCRHIVEKPSSCSAETTSYQRASLLTAKGLIMTVVGGFMVGFGTRYAGGCTSGHSIMGLANLQWPSLVATICFMAGGMLMANFILPFILKW